VTIPKVAIIVPARNAAEQLPACLATALRQTRAADEIWLVIGPSSDGSQEIADAFADASVRVLANPPGHRASAINAALAETTADVLVMLDAQARLHPTYIERALEVLKLSHADVVGGPMRPVGRTPIGRALALALQSWFGVGDSQFHFAGPARQVDSVYLGVYRKERLAAVGLYNPALLRTEDDDVNARIRASGGTIWIDPDLQSTYLCRNSLAAIWHQFFGYGYWKVALAAIRPEAIRPRHFVPAAFLIAILGSAIIAVLGWPWLLVAVLAAYALTSLLAVLTAPNGSTAAKLLMPVVSVTMHVAYGAGTLFGLLSGRRLSSLAHAGTREISPGP
jgi:glycosyltransferase involved in cell wall biosynthesis